MDEVAIFRASKRRKFSRAQRDPLPEIAPLLPSDETRAAANLSNIEAGDDDDAKIDVSSLIRARKQLRKPVVGVEFSNMRMVRRSDADDSRSVMVQTDQATENPIDITNRFTSGTGQIVDVDQHMLVPLFNILDSVEKHFANEIRVAFIDSEMAKRRNNLPPQSNSQQQIPSDDSNSLLPMSTGRPLTAVTQANSTNPSSTRQLSEVDLGSTAHAINLARTQAALNRVKTGQPPIADEPKPPKVRKPRIGRDGKPMKPRPRKRRNSEDIARDALVEQVLHENKLDIYDDQNPDLQLDASGKDAADGGGEDAGVVDSDERLAEQFRQQYIDSMAERRHRHKAVSQPKGPGTSTTESRGPKLGGSRSARAKMVAQMQQQQGQGAGKK